MVTHYSNLSSLEGLAPKEINLNEYTLAQERNDERFGLIFFMRSKSSTRTIFVKDRSKALTEEHSREISTRVRISSNYLLKIYGIKQVPQSDTFQIYFEDFSQDLHTEISRHVSQGSRFAEAELYAVLYSAVAGLDALQQNNISHDFIVPMNILKFSKDLYKLHDNFIISPKSYLYTQALRGNYQRYLAPELFESLSHKKEKPDAHDPHKADIFALGMCILDAGLLNTSGDFINRKLMILDERAIERALKKFGDIYSNAMVQILEDMLFPDPSKRPSPSTLLRRLPGKPLVKGQALSGKKRKPLDRAIFASPERGLQQARSRSPRISANEEPKRSYLPTQDFTSLGRTSMMRGSYSPDNLTVHQPTRQSPIRDRIVDIARINVSSNIKNDPVLSQFLKKLHHEPIQVVEAVSRSPINDRNLAKSIDPLNIPHTAQFPTRHSPSGAHAREVEVRSIPAQKPFAETMKPSYLSTFLSPIHGDDRAFAQTYKSGLLASAPGLETKLKEDHGPLRTYHLESLKNGTDTRTVFQSQSGGLGHHVPVIINNGTTTTQTVNFPRTPQSEAKKDNTLNLDSGKPKSKIDELIAKALERSSTNLFLSQQVSAEIHSNIEVEPFRSSYHSTSSQPNALKTILERPGSEGYLTPLVSDAQGRFGSSSLVDLINSRK